MARKPGICDEEFLHLIRLIYEAAEDAARWPALLERSMELFDATASTIEFCNSAHKSSNIAAFADIDPDCVRLYVEHYHQKNVWQTYRPDPVHFGHAVTGQMLVPDAVFNRSEFYQDYLRRHDIFHLLGGRLEEAPNTAYVSLYRPRTTKPFGDTEVSFLDALLPHFHQALKLHERISLAEARNSDLADVLDRVPVGVLVVDNSARVLSANRRATQILASHDGLTSGPEGLRAAVPAQTSHLRKLIAAAGATCRGCGFHPGGTLAIDRPSLKPPLGVRVIPLTRQTCLTREPQAAAIVFVSDPGMGPTVRHLVSLFQLTPAEERLAIKLVEGHTLEQAAEALHVSRNTAATQLKSIFQKTGTRRQAELIRFLLGSVAALTP